MRVLVTGGTGFIGSHTAAELRRRGHDVRLLVRSGAKAHEVLAAHGVDAEIAIGDMTDLDSVRSAMAGCDSVLHAAATIGVASASAADVGVVNVTGARNVLGAAADAGLDPIVYTSSVAVHLPTDEPRITVTTPLAEPLSPYGASKRAIELLVRELVDSGAPVVTFVISGVYGPVSPTLDNSFAAILAALESMMVTPPGGANVIDVRDLAQLLAAATQPGRGPRRYVAGGHFVTWPQWVAALERAVGRPVPSFPLTAEELVTMGRECDAARARGDAAPLLSEEAAIIMCSGVPSDDDATLADLGGRYRPLDETFADTVAYLRSIGALPLSDGS